MLFWTHGRVRVHRRPAPAITNFALFRRRLAVRRRISALFRRFVIGHMFVRVRIRVRVRVRVRLLIDRLTGYYASYRPGNICITVLYRNGSSLNFYLFSNCRFLRLRRHLFNSRRARMVKFIAVISNLLRCFFYICSAVKFIFRVSPSAFCALGDMAHITMISVTIKSFITFGFVFRHFYANQSLH